MAKRLLIDTDPNFRVREEDTDDALAICYLGELKFHQDARAAAAVMALPVTKTLMAMDVCSQAVFTVEHLGRLRDNGGEECRLCEDFVEPWLKLNRKVFFRKRGFFPWDVVTAAYLVDESLFEGGHYTLDVVERGMMRGRLVDVRRAQGPGAADDGARTVSMPMKLDGARFTDLLLARLCQL